MQSGVPRALVQESDSSLQCFVLILLLALTVILPIEGKLVPSQGVISQNELVPLLLESLTSLPIE